MFNELPPTKILCSAIQCGSYNTLSAKKCALGERPMERIVLSRGLLSWITSVSEFLFLLLYFKRRTSPVAHELLKNPSISEEITSIFFKKKIFNKNRFFPIRYSVMSILTFDYEYWTGTSKDFNRDSCVFMNPSVIILYF